jgi:hypothetical protein
MNGDRFSSVILWTIGIDLVTKGAGMDGVRMRCKALMTRACMFEYAGWKWEWRYGRSADGTKVNRHTLLVCEVA